MCWDSKNRQSLIQLPRFRLIVESPLDSLYGINQSLVIRSYEVVRITNSCICIHQCMLSCTWEYKQEDGSSGILWNDTRHRLLTGSAIAMVVITLLVQDQQPAQKLHGRYSRVPHLFSKIDCEPGSFWNSGRSKWSRMDLFWRSACIGRCHFLIHFDPLIREKYSPIWSSVKVMYRSCERKRVWDGIGQVKVSISTHMHTRIHHQIHYQIHHPSPPSTVFILLSSSKPFPS